MLRERNFLKRLDWRFIFSFLALPIVGLVILYSAGYDPDLERKLFGWIPLVVQSRVFERQLIWLSGSLLLFIIISFISPQFWGRIAYPLYILVIILLFGVMFFGKIVNGSQRWLDLGPLHLQPSELMKPALLFTMARYLSKHPPKKGQVYTFKELIIPGLIVLFPVALIIEQPDLGTSLAVAAIGCSMILFIGVRWKLLMWSLIFAVLALPAAWYNLMPYQQRRVLVLLDPESDPQGSGWHITQSKIAVGSGEFFGKGYMQGTQAQLEFLPERTTDFIFSVLAEEGGFFVCFLVVLLYAFFLYNLLQVALRANDLFTGLISFGVAAMIFFHIVVNIGMVIGLLPVVGIPLPFLSYGGSALLSNVFAVGLVHAIHIRRRRFVNV